MNVRFTAEDVQRWQVESQEPAGDLCLAEALDRDYDKAYVVLGGEGMRAKLRQFYVSGGLSPI